MLDIDFIKDIEKCSKELVDNLDHLFLLSVPHVPIKIRTQARGIRMVCDKVHHATWKYLQIIEGTYADKTVVYTMKDLIIDLLVGAYLFSRICGTSYHYYEDVVDACEEYCGDCNTWHYFHKLKEALEKVYILNLL